MQADDPLSLRQRKLSREARKSGREATACYLETPFCHRFDTISQ